MELFLYRHAATPGNLEKRYIGVTDEPLSHEGIQAAAALGADPTIKKVYVSGLRRTRETAWLWFPNAVLLPIPDLGEMNFGLFEGKHYRELDGDASYQAWLDSNCEEKCPGGESKSQYTCRVLDAFDRLVSSELAAGADKLILVVHGGAIMAIMSHHADPAVSYFDWHVGHCQGYRGIISPNTWATRHLFSHYNKLEGDFTVHDDLAGNPDRLSP